MLEKKKCVLVAEEQDNIIEVEVNLKSIYTYLKGTSTIIGAIPELDAVILKCNESPFDLMVNRNTHLLPLEEKYVLGPIIIVRMDENSEHQDLTLSEVESTLHHRE
jgi:GTP-sensing pleiotropic transcriptional regulator CodY